MGEPDHRSEDAVKSNRPHLSARGVRPSLRLASTGDSPANSSASHGVRGLVPYKNQKGDWA